MVRLAAVNRHFSKLDLCAWLRRYGCPWRPEEGGCEWHNTGGAGVPTLVLCKNVSAHKHGAISPSSAVPTQDSELTVEVTNYSTELSKNLVPYTTYKSVGKRWTRLLRGTAQPQSMHPHSHGTELVGAS